MTKIKEYFSSNIYKIIAVFLVLVLALSLIPLFLISFNNYPTRDDYFLGYNVYMSHGTFADTIKSSFDRAEIAYNQWQGLFTVNFLLALTPSSFGSQYYAITAFAGIILLLISSYYFGYQLLVKLLKISKDKYVIVTTLLLFLSIQFLPSAVEGFYWNPSVVTYTIPYSAMIAFGGVIISYFKSEKKNKALIYLAPLILLSSFISGCNYIVVLFALLILVLLMAFLLRHKKREIKLIALVAIIMLIGLLVSVFAPGNAIRAQGEQGLSAIFAILISFPAAARSVVQIFSKMPVFIGTFVFIPLIYKSVLENSLKLEFKHPILFVLLSFCLYSATFTPTYYAMYGTGLGRVENIRMFMLLWIAIINFYYLLGYFNKIYIKICSENKVNEKDISKIRNSFFSKYRYLAVIILIITFTASMYSIDLNRVTSISAYNSISSGEAAQYHKQQLKRESLYLSDEKDVEVIKLSVKPYVLYFWDIEESEDGRYEHMERYYDKDTIVIGD